MNPHQRNKVDISTLSPEEQKIFRLYGKLPTRNDLLKNKLAERKYFDSGDYALSKAGKASDTGVTSIGSQHPSPESIPHLASPPGPGIMSPGGANGDPARSGSLAVPQSDPRGSFSTGTLGTSPVRESALNRETSADDVVVEDEEKEEKKEEESKS